MNRPMKALAVMLVALLGLWGCAQGPSSSQQAAAERVKSLETKCVRLESDYRAVANARDQLRKQLEEMEQEQGRLAAEAARCKLLGDDLKDLQNKNELLRQQFESRTAERDALQEQFEQFRTGIRSLLGKVDSEFTGRTTSPVSSENAEVVPSKL